MKCAVKKLLCKCVTMCIELSGNCSWILYLFAPFFVCLFFVLLTKLYYSTLSPNYFLCFIWKEKLSGIDLYNTSSQY